MTLQDFINFFNDKGYIAKSTTTRIIFYRPDKQLRYCLQSRVLRKERNCGKDSWGVTQWVRVKSLPVNKLYITIENKLGIN